MSKTELAVTRQWFGFCVYLCLPVHVWRPKVDLKYLPLLSLLIYLFIYLFACDVKVYLHVCVQVHTLVRMHRKARGGCQVAPITPPVPLGESLSLNLESTVFHSFSNQCPLSGLHWHLHSHTCIVSQIDTQIHININTNKIKDRPFFLKKEVKHLIQIFQENDTACW